MAIINGIVRGIIIGGGDPSGRGRVQVQMPAMAGSGAAWAPVCRAMGAQGGAGNVGGAVWVAFENGDPAYPVVLGLAD
jgi:uncharacterized protein involved in type VI secretion and phage assembly